MIRLSLIASCGLLIMLSGCAATNANYQLTQGMSKQQVLEAIGAPDVVKVSGDYEFWYYKPYMVNSKNQYHEVTFDNSRVASFINPGYLEQRSHDLKGLPDYSKQDVTMAYAYKSTVNHQ